MLQLGDDTTAAKLNVKAQNNDPAMYVKNGGNSIGILMQAGNNANNYLIKAIDENSAVEVFSVRKDTGAETSNKHNMFVSGRVGMGHASAITPIRGLDMRAEGGSLLLYGQVDTAGTGPKIEFKADSTGNDRRIKGAIQFVRDDPGTRGTGNIRFMNNGVNSDTNVSQSDTKMSITPNGVCFGTDTAAANALDDYEEGTWTPGMTSSSAITVTNSTCRYTKIGRLVHVHGLTRRNDSNTYNGNITLTNLPFTVGSIDSVSGNWWSDSGSDNGHKGTFLVPNGGTTANPLHGSTPATTSRYVAADGTNAAFPNNEYFFFSITYTV